MKRLLIPLFIFLFFLFPAQAFAEDFVIDSFDSKIHIQNDGIVGMKEAINVDFFPHHKHGIYRDIPLAYEDANGKKTYTELSVIKVSRNNADEPYEIQKEGTTIRIKIGDADKTVSGKQNYQITYSVKGVLRSFPDHDELYWNATGNNWLTSIGGATATVSLPKNGMQKVACFQGYAGSQGECSATIASPTTAKYITTEPLSTQQGMTIVAGYTKGLVPILTVQRPKTFWEKFTSWPSQLTLWTGILGAFGFVFYTWYKNGRDMWFGQGVLDTEKGNEKPIPLIGGHESLVVEFTPPQDLRPAELGVLMDERADTSDVIATIIDLAARGYLTITEVPKKWLFGAMDYQLSKKKKVDSELLSYEKLLLNNLFSSGDTIKVSALKNTFYDDLKEVKDKLYEHVVSRGLFPTNPEKVWEKYLGIGIVLIVLGVFGLIMTISSEIIFLADLAFAVIIAGILLAIFSFHMPRRTAKGREMYRRARGYRMFIEKAETNRQQFFEKKNLFNEVLPYAVMFGLTDKFFNAMKDIGIKTQPGWYIGSHPFTYGSFNSSMNSFSTSMTGAIASTPSSSGGFSGGSSGGGFGGGGGGSW